MIMLTTPVTVTISILMFFLATPRSVMAKTMTVLVAQISLIVMVMRQQMLTGTVLWPVTTVTTAILKFFLAILRSVMAKTMTVMVQ